jgi:hypothetical protein
MCAACSAAALRAWRADRAAKAAAIPMSEILINVSAAALDIQFVNLADLVPDFGTPL